MLTIPPNNGGHMSTSVVADRLGIQVKPLAMRNCHDLDFERLWSELKEEQLALIYLDQSTLLFPLDPKPIRDLVDQYSPKTLIHYDGSHVNGLILGKACSICLIAVQIHSAGQHTKLFLDRTKAS